MKKFAELFAKIVTKVENVKNVNFSKCKKMKNF